jgi:hypothetical protein
MLRCMRIAVGLALILAMTGRDACAQWSYGGWGWGGWGASPQENAVYQGAGNYAMGAGLYNLDTTRAKFIDADTVQKFNDYMAHVTEEAARRQAARAHQQSNKNQMRYDDHKQRLRDEPTAVEIENGDALNVAVADLSDPRLGNSARHAARAQVPASLIAEAPFVYVWERVTFMLNELRSSIKWSEVFEEMRFANDQKVFDDLVARLQREADEGEVSPKSQREAKAFVNDLRSKVEAQPLKDPEDQKEALRFLTACTALLGLLESPNIGPALMALRTIRDTTVGNLLGFMHGYNLRFGAARTPRQRQVCRELYPILDQTRALIRAEAKLDSSAAPLTNPKYAADFLQKLGRAR